MMFNDPNFSGKEQGDKTRGTLRNLIFSGVFLAAGLFFLFYPFSRGVKGLSKAVPLKMTRVCATAPGFVSEIYASKGEKVEKGAPVARLEDKGLLLELARTESEVETLTARLAKLKKEKEWLERLMPRYRNMHERRVLEKEKVERLEIELFKIKREIESAAEKIGFKNMRKDFLEERVSSLEIRAPFGGVILNDTAKLRGRFVKKGKAVCVIADMREARLEMLVEEKELRRVNPGQEARVRFVSEPRRTVGAEVVSIEPAMVEEVEKIWMKKNMAKVILAVESLPADYRVGMLAKVRILSRRENVAGRIMEKVLMF